MTTIHERLSCTTCESYIAEDCRCKAGELLWPRCDLYIPDMDRVLEELNRTIDQCNLLVSTCKLAMEWAAGYPLGSGIDKLAAGEVYNACKCALLMKGDTPNA